MKFSAIIDNVSTQIILKRFASAYVIDHRNLDENELLDGLAKTAPQYFFRENVEKAWNRFVHSSDRNERIIAPYLLRKIVMNADDFVISEKETNEAVIEWEKSVIDRSNEELPTTGPAKEKCVDLFKFVLETAWANNDEISVDEKNLIEKLKARLKITEFEYRLLEAQMGKFPLSGNTVHTRSDIENVRNALQKEGLLISVRDEEKADYDVIPEEIAATLRDVIGIEMRDYGFKELLASKYVRSKSYYHQVLKKCEIEHGKYDGMEDLQALLIEHVKPSVVLGGTSPRDGLATEELSKWCRDLGLPTSGSKSDLVMRIIGAYDNLRQQAVDDTDERELWYSHFAKLAHRDISFFRQQQLISKDIEIERHFESATDYLFETRLGHRPLKTVGSAHPDGILSCGNGVMMWDNKSKESPVSLRDHIKQFSFYIRGSEKAVEGFLVIGPSFTEDSALEAMRFNVQEGVPITLITAEELKAVSEKWSTKKETEGSFRLGYLLQPGRFNSALVPL